MKLWQKISLIIFGLFLTLVTLEIGLRIGGFIFMSLQEYRNQASLKQKSECRIMCLGESTAALGGQNSYPSQLENILNQKTKGMKFCVVNKGIAGNDTSDILAKLKLQLDRYRPHIVIAMMGINDQPSYFLYEQSAGSMVARFFKSLRIYKLSKLILLHAKDKMKEKREKLGRNRKYVFQKEGDGNIPIASEEILKKAIELNPGSFPAYMDALVFYKSQNRFVEAKEMDEKAQQVLEKTINLHPLDSNAYMNLGVLHRTMDRFPESERMILKAIELNPLDINGYDNLVWAYLHQEKFVEVEEVFKKIIELDPNNIHKYIEFGIFYYDRKKIEQAEKMFKKAIELNPEESRPYIWLSRIYRETGLNELANVLYRKANSVRLEYYDPILRYNYQEVKKILDRRGAQLMCVQYPMRSIEPLKMIFEGQEGVVFVSNEQIFRMAVDEDGYSEYFVDNFAGDFGHCTQKGNRLLAENIANVILKEYFNK